MIVKLLTEQHLEVLSLKWGCRGSSESTHFKMPHCWKSRVTAHVLILRLLSSGLILRGALAEQWIPFRIFVVAVRCLVPSAFLYTCAVENQINLLKISHSCKNINDYI